MASHTNIVVVLGNLCKEPNLRYTPSGKSICDLLVAVNRKGGKADYLPVIVWGDDAEACHRHLKKGSLVHVVGKMSSRNYTKKEGDEETQHVAIELVADKIDFL